MVTVVSKIRQSSHEFFRFCTFSLENCFGRAVKEMSHTSCFTPEAESACRSVLCFLMEWLKWKISSEETVPLSALASYLLSSAY